MRHGSDRDQFADTVFELRPWGGGNATLILAQPRLVAGEVGRYHASLESAGLSASAEIYSYGDDGLPDFFESLAADWRGFEGTKEWGSLEGQLEFAATTADPLGHMELAIHLTPDAGPGNWAARAFIVLEAGGIDRLVHMAKRFFQLPRT